MCYTSSTLPCSVCVIEQLHYPTQYIQHLSAFFLISHFILGPQKPSAPTAPTPAPRSSKGPSFPDLPSVPTDLPNIPDSLPGANSAGGEDVDFDDLTRRFEDLKKKKQLQADFFLLKNTSKRNVVVTVVNCSFSFFR